MIAYIGLGGNLNEPLLRLNEAIAYISQIDQTVVCEISNVYRSAPVGLVEQPDFFNQVISVETMLSPLTLLLALQSIEARMGRVRDVRWGPRVIDCDLLLYGDQVMQTDDLILPHPRMTERAFVLLPLKEIYPDFVSLAGQAIQDLCAAVANQYVIKEPRAQATG